MNEVLEAVLTLAKSQVGYKEKPENNTKYSRFFDVEAWQWFNTKKNPGTDWCAIFICWLFAQNCTLGQKQALSFLGCPAPKYNAAAGCGFLYDYMKAKGYKSDIKSVKPGDIVFFKSGKKCAHVGIAETVSGGKVTTIEGNKGNMVKRVVHNISSNIYFGVMSPDWSKAHLYEKKEKPSDPAPVKPEPIIPAPAAPVTYNMKVTTRYDYLMLRAYASTSAPVLQKLKKGKIVIFQGEEKNVSGSTWVRVKYNSIIGWACKHEAGVTYNYLTKV